MYRVVGLMSGTSLDGLDAVLCDFEEVNYDCFKGKILKARTYAYDKAWQRRLRFASLLSGRELMKLHADYGRYLGERVRELLTGETAGITFVASHGHTVFHEPGRGFTFQVGCGAHLAAVAGIPVVCDLRSGDVALGGQGAPLVPLGERFLFPEFKAFLNLGGFANVSLHEEQNVRAWDVCAFNYVLNALARREGLSYDPEGSLASEGKMENTLFKELENLEYYSRKPPKSLGAEDAENSFLPLLKPEIPASHLLHTWCHHAASRIVSDFVYYGSRRPLRILVTGGGARNVFFISCLKKYGIRENLDFIVPDENIVDFKEAYIFAFLGLMRWLERPAALASVTGAARDAVTGAVYLT